ncbi:zinc finger MYND domain-containing protein 15 isoform X4 [Accipiter gentilis]|uniref:zinc finger MYND domain-containing protein 15 isoform X4 n=1 Tax=Astur gentilis TaxID=8957 RepID=UPI002110A5C4|nr:zinc finger MYND domain-containing protein 15 isoform X4 [Accipiter gentilis]
MEFLTGYRAELLELVSLVLGWRWGARGTPPKPGALRRLPPEPGPWVLHALPNARLGVALPAGGAWRGGGPSGDPRGPLCGDTALTLPDLCRTLTFISLEEEEEEEEEEGGGGGRPGQVLVVTWVLLLTDARGAPLGFDFELGSPRAPPAPPPARRALALLCRAMGCPMAGGPPRRPRQLDVGDAGLHTALQPAAARLGVTLVGTHLRGWGPPPTLGTPALRSRLCHACRGLARTPLPCPQCRAVLYCSEGCRAAEALGVHRGWCRQLGGFMGRTAALAQLPFTFTAEVTSETFDKERFLGARGLSRGGWAHLSMLVRAPDYGVGLGEDCHPLGTPHDLPFEGLQPAGEVSLPPAPSEPPPPNSFFSSWQQYYAWRGLPLSSPLAALLSYPLSLYYIVTSLVPQHFPELNILRKRSLRVQVEESGRELQLVGLFWVRTGRTRRDWERLEGTGKDWEHWERLRALGTVGETGRTGRDPGNWEGLGALEAAAGRALLGAVGAAAPCLPGAAVPGGLRAPTHGRAAIPAAPHGGAGAAPRDPPKGGGAPGGAGGIQHPPRPPPRPRCWRSGCQHTSRRGGSMAARWPGRLWGWPRGGAPAPPSSTPSAAPSASPAWTTPCPGEPDP